MKGTYVSNLALDQILPKHWDRGFGRGVNNCPSTV